MEDREILKAGILFLIYGVGTPLLGLFLWWRPRYQRWVFAAVCFMTMGGLMTPSDWGLTLSFREYRGHAKGYHFYFMEALALGLLISHALGHWRSFRLLPPGLWLYFLYCLASMVSIVNAPAPNLTIMVFFKWVKMAIIFITAYNFIREEKDLRLFLLVMCLCLGWQFVVVAKQKYLNHIYQVEGTFEHQNSLSMFATMIGMVFLAAALGPKHPRSNWYFAAYLACAFIQEAALSRGGMVFYAAGTVAVIILSLIDEITKRRVVITACLGAVGLIGLFMTIDTIVARFQDDSNMSSGVTRELLNEVSRNILADYPLGVGWNNFGVVVNYPYPYGEVIDNWEREGHIQIDRTYQKGIVESHYYLILAETGYHSLLFYLIFISVFLWKNLRGAIYFRHHFIGSVSLGIFVGCGANYVQSVLERVLTQPRNMMLWMLLLAVTARIDAWRKEARPPSAETEQEQEPKEYADQPM